MVASVARKQFGRTDRLLKESRDFTGISYVYQATVHVHMYMYLMRAWNNTVWIWRDLINYLEQLGIY